MILVYKRSKAKSISFEGVNRDRCLLKTGKPWQFRELRFISVMFLSIIERFQSKKFISRYDLNVDGKGANRNSVEFFFIGETSEHQNESLFFFLL